MIRLLLLAFLLLVSPARAQDTSISVGAGIGNAGYPVGSIPYAVSQTATTGGISLSSPLPPAGKFDYVCGFSISSGTATTALTTTISLVNVIGGTWTLGAPVTGAPPNNLTVLFNPCMATGVPGPFQAAFMSITALGTGGAGQAAQFWGFMQ